METNSSIKQGSSGRVNYQEMKDSDDGEGQEGIEATLKQLWAPSKDDDGVIGDGNNSGDKEDHEVTQEFEAGA